MAQTVKGLPAMRKTRVQSLGQDDPLEKEMTIYSSILAWKIHGWKSLAGYSSYGHKESDMTERLHLLSFFFLEAERDLFIKRKRMERNMLVSIG